GRHRGAPARRSVRRVLGLRRARAAHPAAPAVVPTRGSSDVCEVHHQHGRDRGYASARCRDAPRTLPDARTSKHTPTHARGRGSRTIAGDREALVTSTSAGASPPLAFERARMSIASTIASAAMGVDIGSSDITRQMAKERGGTAESSIWFDAGPKIPTADA